MTVFMKCPYCYKMNPLRDIGLAAIDFEVYHLNKCVHCIKEFIYKPKIIIDTFDKPENAT